MRAYFDKDGSPKVAIKINGTKGKVKEITALLDTGHNGSLSLPLFDLIEIGAELSGFGPVGLADGSQTNMYFFTVKVEIDGEIKDVQANMICNPNITEAIIGLELLSPYVAVINFNKKQILLKTEEQLERGIK